MHVKDNLCFCFNKTSKRGHFYLLVNLKGSKKIKEMPCRVRKGELRKHEYLFKKKRLQKLNTYNSSYISVRKDVTYK